MQLLWGLVGLEALYVKGQSELTKQVQDKSQAFLGRQESFKKALSQMYDFRSRFVHGDLGFPALGLLRDARDEVARFDDDLIKATSIATAVLAATIQQLILRDWSGVDFEYKPLGSKMPASLIATQS